MKEKYKDIADLLFYFPSIRHEHFKVLKLFETKNFVIEAQLLLQSRYIHNINK